MWILRAEYIWNHVRYAENTQCIAENDVGKDTMSFRDAPKPKQKQHFDVPYKNSCIFRLRRALSSY